MQSSQYCLHECPIGCDRPISDKVLGIDTVTVKLFKGLEVDEIGRLKDKLLDIAADGEITDDEVPELEEVLNYLEEVSKTISELKIIGEKVLKR